jgi:hypothetical protein
VTETRAFPLADVLSITTGKLLTRGDGAALDDILNWMTRDHLAWWQAPRATDACTEALTAQHPFLADLLPPADLDQPDLYAWLVAAEERHGRELTIRQLDDWKHQDPAQELLDRVELCQLLEPNPARVSPGEIPGMQRIAELMGRFTSAMNVLASSVGGGAEQVAGLKDAILDMGDLDVPPAADAEPGAH